jgi:CubicO group peptidase (beta-lactamase class C family)
MTAITFEQYPAIDGAQLGAQIKTLGDQGYRMISLSVYGDADSPLYAAVWVKRSGPKWEAQYGMNATAYEAFINTSKSDGYKPVLVSATGPRANAVYAAVVEKGIEGLCEEQHDIPLNQFGNLNGDTGPESIRMRNLYIRSFAIYGEPNDRRYIAVWHSNPGYVKWHVHPADSAADFKTNLDLKTQLPGYFKANRDAATQLPPGYRVNGYRLAYVALSADQTYCCVFTDDVVGPWKERHNMTRVEYDEEFSQQNAARYYPICLQGGGTTAKPVYAAIFAKRDISEFLARKDVTEIPLRREWRVTSDAAPSWGGSFDTIFQDFMKSNGVRAAQFALSKNGSTLLSRAYTWAEPGYRITTPSDRFLLASCSKLFCAQAIQTLFDSGAARLLVKPNVTEPVVGDVIKGNRSGAIGTVTRVSSGLSYEGVRFFDISLTSVTGTFTTDDNAASLSLSGGIVGVYNITPDGKLVVSPGVGAVGNQIKGNSSGATGTISAIVQISRNWPSKSDEPDPEYIPYTGKHLITLTSVTGTFTTNDNAVTTVGSTSRATLAVLEYTPPSGCTPSTRAYPLLGFSNPADPRSDSITIQQLLDHRSGYNHGRNPNLPDAGYRDPTYDMREIGLKLKPPRRVEKLDVVRYMYGQQLQYTPGEGGSYSNYGYLLLTAIVEHVTGRPYFEYVQEKVLAPLGLTNVRLSSTQAQQRDPNQAICEDQGLGGDPINVTSNHQIPNVYGGDGQIKEVAAGSAGLTSSASALTQFARSYFRALGNLPSNFAGSTFGATSFARSLPNGIDWAYVLNTRDFLPPRPGENTAEDILKGKIGDKIESMPELR